MSITITRPSDKLKLFMLLLGSKAPQRNVEQHDYFFGIASSIGELVPEIKKFWPEAGNSIHVDGWREVTQVDGYEISILTKPHDFIPSNKLFFINLGGYQSNKLEEQHYIVLTVQNDRATATQVAKKTIFFKANSIKGARSHIDEKYGVDVDDIYQIEDILAPYYKERYHISIVPAEAPAEDEIHLGYFKLDKL